MDEREPAHEDAQGSEGRSPPDEERVDTDEDDASEDDDIKKPGPSGISASPSPSGGHLFVPSVRITEINDASSDTYDPSEYEEEEDSLASDFGYHRYYYFGGSSSSASGSLERRIPPTESQFLELCRSELPKSEGRMATYVRRLRRERDRTLAHINEMQAMLLSLRDLIRHPPERKSRTTKWYENYPTYNVDQSLGVNNKMKYYVVMSEIYFIQSDEFQISLANGYTFDGVTLSKRLDGPSTSGSSSSQRRKTTFGVRGIPIRRRSSTNSQSSSSGTSGDPSDKSMPGSGQAIPEGENPSKSLSPLESGSSSQPRPTNASGKMEKRSTSSQASANDNQSESVPQDAHDSGTNNRSTGGRKSNLDSSTNKKLARQSRSNQDSMTSNQLAKESRSNQDSSTNKQLVIESRSNRDSSTNQLERQKKNNRGNGTNKQLKRGSPRENQDASTNNLNPTGTDNLAIPGPSGSFSSEHSYSMNSSDPGPSGFNQNEGYVAHTNHGETANVGASINTPSTLMGDPLIASPQLPSVIHSNQSFYGAATGNVYTGASTGSNTVSSYSTANYSDNTQRGRYFGPNQVYIEDVAYSALPVYYSSEGNYGIDSGYAGANGSGNASLNTYPAAASEIIGNNSGVQSFHPVNLYSQGDTSGGNIIQSYSGYVPSFPMAYDNMQNNTQHYGSDSVNDYPYVSGQRYGYGQPYNSSNSVVYSSAMATFNPYVPQETQNFPNTVVYGPTVAPQVQNVLGMNATQGGMYPLAPSGGAIGPPSNIYPHASRGMYNTMSNESNTVQLYIQNSWQNTSGHTVIYNSGYLAPGINTPSVQGYDAQLISHEEIVDGEPENLVSPEGSHDEGSARTRGFTKVSSETSDQQNDQQEANPTQTNSTEADAAERMNTNEGSAQSSVAGAGSSEGGSAQTSASKGGKTKISAHKRTFQSSPGESSAKQSTSEGRRNHGKGKVQASTSRERAPEITSSDKASHNVNKGKKLQLEPSGGNAPETSITEGAQGNIHRSSTRTDVADGKNEERGTQDADSGIRTRSKTRELNRKEAEKSSFTGVGAATGVERKILRSTTRSASRTGEEASSYEAVERKRTKTSDLSEIPSNTRILRTKQGNKSRPPPGGGSFSQVLTKTKIKPDTSVPASEVGPSTLALEPGPSGTSSAGTSQGASEDVSAAGAAVKTSTSSIVEECAPGVETSKGNASETLTKATVSGVSNAPSTSGKLTKTKTNAEVHQAKGKVSEKSYHKPTNQADSSEEIPGDRDSQATDKRKDSLGTPQTPGKNICTRAAVPSTQTLEAKPSTSVQRRKWVPATTVFKPLTIRDNEANTSFNVIKSSRPRTLTIKREKTSSILTGSSLSNPALKLHKQAKKSDWENRGGNENTLMRIQQMESNLARYRNEYNNILKLLSIIDDYIIEAPLYIEDNPTPQTD